MSRLTLVAALAAAAVVAACSSSVPASTPALSPRASAAPLTPPPTLMPTPIPSVAPSATPLVISTPAPTKSATSQPAGGDFPAGSVIVTFQVIDEQFRVLVTDPANIAIANDLLAGKEAPSIPNGVVVRDDPSVNSGWSWHIDPATLDFADMTTEVCDGLPSFVERGEITSDQFCPWSAEVVAVEPANP